MSALSFLPALVAALLLLAAAGKSGKGGKQATPDDRSSGKLKGDAMEKLMSSLDPEQQDKLNKMLTPEMQQKMNKMMGGDDLNDVAKLLKSMNADEPVSTKPAPVMRMTFTDARSMISDFHSALTSRAARRAFEKRIGNKTSDNEKDEKTNRQEMLERMAPMAEMLVKDILKKYGFQSGPGAGGQWGFQHAVRSALEAGGGKGKLDKKITTAIDDFEGVLLGTGSQSGRIAALDSLAEKFLEMDVNARKEALKITKETTGGEVYVQTMKNIAKKGDSYIVEAYKNVQENLEEEEDPKTKSELRAHLNVLREFMQDDQHERSQKATSEL